MQCRAALLLAIAFSTAMLACSDAPAAPAKVKSVRSGDTLVVTDAGKRKTVRLAGVMAPGPRACQGRQSRARLARMAKGKRVKLIRDRRRYYVSQRGRDLGRKLLSDGLADLRPGKFKRQRSYKRARNGARNKRKGIWGCSSSSIPDRGRAGGGRYDIGNPIVRDVWIDPSSGNDSANGSTRGTALRTIEEAWSRIPSGSALTGTGYRLMLTAGNYPAQDMPNYWEGRYGTYTFPIMLVAADGDGSARLAPMNVFDTRYLYLIGVRIDTGGDAFHCELCDHLLIRRSMLRGNRGSTHETVKVNQSRYTYIEDSAISGAGDNAIDFVAVQNGHLIANTVTDAADWCAYAKGGSAYLVIDSNEFANCGTGGFTAGQGTGFQFMTSPWIQYEAYDVKVFNNIVHDVEGAGLGVNGGYNVLLAYNTLYRVGERSHGMEFVFGSRSCDGSPGDDGRQRCQQYLSAGGWGTTRVDDGSNFVRIPNHNVYVFNNLLYNPSGYQSQWEHLQIAGAYSGPWQAGSNVPVPTRADENLQVRGNLLWNGPSNLPTGGDDSTLRANNAINTLQPQLVNPGGGDFRPGGNVSSAQTYAIPAFDWSNLPANVPAGNPSNTVATNRAGEQRGNPGRAGAY